MVMTMTLAELKTLSDFSTVGANVSFLTAYVSIEQILNNNDCRSSYSIGSHYPILEVELSS